jgi:PilZ domain-containing protein
MTTEPPVDASAPAERRQFNRRRLVGTIEIEWGSTILTGLVRDIGPQGLFVEITPPLWVGATFLARLVVDPPLHLNCTVRRVEPGSGIAVTFELPEESGKAQLATLLAQLPKL